LWEALRMALEADQSVRRGLHARSPLGLWLQEGHKDCLGSPVQPSS